jgi:hyperosmotically inducible periplasmic protein
MNSRSHYLGFFLSVVLAVALLGCASGRPVGERVDDQWIETKVKAALVADPDVSGTSIQVEVRNGDVQLSGFVKSQRQAQQAINVTRQVEGVRNVINKMSVRS